MKEEHFKFLRKMFDSCTLIRLCIRYCDYFHLKGAGGEIFQISVIDILELYIAQIYVFVAS